MLDKQQEEIVNSTEKNIIVVAGAGSGKTRVLIERIRKLLKDGVPPSNIVAITFTNMAAEEMKERLVDVNDIGDAFIGTIHSFANKIYKTSGISYLILNSEIEQKVYHEVLSMREYSDLTFRRWLKYQDLQQKVERFQAPEEELNNFLLPSEQNVLMNCRKDLLRIYKRDNIIDFKQLLEYSTAYYQSIGAKLEHLFVDELQDIDKTEYYFLVSLKADNYFFVGDDWQAIYGFKGGDVNIFKNLTQDPNFRTYYLTNNYRNTQSITKMGLQVIHQASKVIIPKNVVVMSKTEGIVTIHTKSQIGLIINMFEKDFDNLKDWFLLTRSNKEAYELFEALKDAEVPVTFIKRTDYTLAELRAVMKENSVKILTVHSSKGLENKKVILYGNFPIVQPSYMLNTEERKVMYVGITRASEELHIFN
jgi:DNA helicase-2/ATP-dependent DNA helicase PcrA